MSGLRTIYNGPPRDEVGELRADQVVLSDLIFGSGGGSVVVGVVDQIEISPSERTVRLRLHDEIDGAFAGEATYDAARLFRVRRLKNINNNEGATP